MAAQTSVAPDSRRTSDLPQSGLERCRRLQEEELRLHDGITRRDEAALLECVDRFGPLLFMAAHGSGAGTSAAEELTEKLFVELWRTPERFHPARGPMALQLLASARR